MKLELEIKLDPDQLLSLADAITVNVQKEVKKAMLKSWRAIRKEEAVE
ncbi:MAG: hypothetical protein ACXAEN_19515 [Candidatus Thorarchaeota archaeon]|jgi:hypothetical protein